MSDKYLRFSQLKGAGVPHSRAVLTEMIKCGGFPKPASSRPGREPAWRLSDVVEWLKDPSSYRMNLGSIQPNLPGFNPGEEHKT
jgi:predicted DNA-binding transcriptional regulator AlpA